MTVNYYNGSHLKPSMKQIKQRLAADKQYKRSKDLVAHKRKGEQYANNFEQRRM